MTSWALSVAPGWHGLCLIHVASTRMPRPLGGALSALRGRGGRAQIEGGGWCALILFPARANAFSKVMHARMSVRRVRTPASARRVVAVFLCNHVNQSINSWRARDATDTRAQNEHGPCPLIALANVLLLRGDLELPAGAPDVSQVRAVCCVCVCVCAPCAVCAVCVWVCVLSDAGQPR